MNTAQKMKFSIKDFFSKWKPFFFFSGKAVENGEDDADLKEPGWKIEQTQQIFDFITVPPLFPCSLEVRLSRPIFS